MPRIPPRRITFIGIGAIGLPMAEQLLAAGFEVTGMDVATGAFARLEAAGFRTDLVEDCRPVGAVHGVCDRNLGSIGGRHRADVARLPASLRVEHRPIEDETALWRDIDDARLAFGRIGIVAEE